jgi:SprT-like family
MRQRAECEHGRRQLEPRQTKDSRWKQFDPLMFGASSQSQDLDPETRVPLGRHKLLAADRDVCSTLRQVSQCIFPKSRLCLVLGLMWFNSHVQAAHRWFHHFDWHDFLVLFSVANISDDTGRICSHTPVFISPRKAAMNTHLASYYPLRSPSDHWIIQNSAHAARPDLGLQEGEAARLALEELENLKGSDAYRLSLVPATYSLQQLQSLFQNLDKHLFRGVLEKNVSFCFSSNLPPSIHGSTSALGVFGNQIVVSLNSDLTRQPSHLPLVASLIHQMTHAYLLVCCGYGDSHAEDKRHDLRHGLAFSSIVHTIQDLLVDNARIPLPDLFFCRAVVWQSAHRPHYRHGRVSLHSYCRFNVSDHEDKIACSAYMRHVIAAANAANADSQENNPPSANMSLSVSGLEGFLNA